MPGEEPNSHTQAMSCPDAPFWEDAEVYELSQITKLGTYKLVPLPPGHSAIGSTKSNETMLVTSLNIVLALSPRDTLSVLALIFSRHMHLLLKLNQYKFSSPLQHH